MSDDRGSAIIIVTLTIVAVVGIGAVVVDLGAVFQERRVLQNGADAGALAIASSCGTSAGCGDPGATASDYADANSDDGASAISELCGSGVTGVGDCADPPADVPAGADYVRVTTETDDGSGGNQVPFRFGRLFGLSGMTVRARALAAWGGPSSITSDLPVTISECEFNQYTNDNTDLKPPPPYDSGYPSPEAVIYLHDTTGANPCPAGPAGSDLPGGFGWLQTSDTCYATSDIYGWYDDKTGRPPPSSCTPTLMAALWKTVVAIPIFDQTNGLTGTNGEYHMLGYAAFYVSGYSIEGQYKEPSAVTGRYPCSGQASCISGFFVDAPAPITHGTLGGPSMGVNVIQLLG